MFSNHRIKNSDVVLPNEPVVNIMEVQITDALEILPASFVNTLLQKFLDNYFALTTPKREHCLCSYDIQPKVRKQDTLTFTVVVAQPASVTASNVKANVSKASARTLRNLPFIDKISVCFKHIAVAQEIYYNAA